MSTIFSTNPITQRVSQKMKKKGETTANEDPTEGDGRRWAMGCKYSFLMDRLPRWREARELNEITTFYCRVTLLFIRHFTWEHALDVDGTGPAGEPSEENLEAVLDVAGLTEEEICTRQLVYMELRGKLQRWFRYHGTKSLKLKKPDSSLEKIIKAFGTAAKAPRRMQTLQFYSKLYYNIRVKPTVDVEWAKLVARAGATGAKMPKRLKHQNDVLARIFATETPEFQAALKKQRDAEHEEEIAAWKASRLDFGDSPRSAQEMEDALVEASHWLPNFAEALSKFLGLNVALLLTGPMGSKGGRIDVKGVHAGKSQGITPMIWPDYDPQSYNDLVKSLLAFGNACFSEDECRRRALTVATPPEEDGDLTETTETSSRPPTPPLPPVLAAVLETAQPGSKTAANHAKPVGIPAMPPPARMSSGRRFGNDAGAISSSSAAARAELAGGNVCAPPMTIPSVPTTTSPRAASTSSAVTSTRPSSPSSTTSSTSSLIVLPPVPATSQPTSLPSKERAPATSRPKPRPKRKEPEGLSVASSVLSSVVNPPPPALAAISAAPQTSRSATSPPPSTPGASATSPAASSPDCAVTPVHEPRSPSPTMRSDLSRVDLTNCPSEIKLLAEYLTKNRDWTDTWVHCVATLVEIERYAEFKPRGSLLSSTNGRPAEVAAWMKRARKLTNYPIDDIDKFADAWLGWWGNNQPEGRLDDDVEDSDLDWSVLYVCGPNGIRLFLLTLAWWGHVLENDDKEERGVIWADTVLDVKVVLDNVLLAAAALAEDEAGDVAVDIDVPAAQSKKRRRGTVSSSSTSVKKVKKGSK